MSKPKPLQIVSFVLAIALLLFMASQILASEFEDESVNVDTVQEVLQDVAVDNVLTANPIMNASSVMNANPIMNASPTMNASSSMPWIYISLPL